MARPLDPLGSASGGRNGGFWAIAIGALATLGGCVGDIGDTKSGAGGQDPNGNGGIDSPTRFTCDPAKKPALGVLRARSTIQYRNTISDLVSWAMKDKTAGPDLMTELADSMAALPDNIPVVPQNDVGLAAAFPDGGWLRADQDQQFFRIQAFYNIGIAVSKALTSEERLGAIVGDCATDGDDGNDAACLKTFIQTFGARALGHPLAAADIAFYTDVYGKDPKADPEAYADVITVMLNAPEFLYAVEHGDAEVAGMKGVYTLTAHELAARLSYHAWDTMPDDALWAAAEDGTLLKDEVFAAQVERLFSDPRARTAMHGFFGDYFQIRNTGGPRGTGGLNYHDLALRNTDPVFKAFAGDDLPSADLEPNMVDDATEMLDWFVWTHPGSVHDLLTTDLSFAKSPDVAKIYGVDPWDGKSTPPSFPAGERPGLFTRALFVSAGVDTSPILKGVYLRRYLLCDTIGRPPPQAANAMVALSTDQTTRQVTEQLTSVSPCSGCHTAWLNPLGFVTENFDGLGRHRTQQTLFESDGSVATKLPVDTQVTPYVEMEDGTTKAKDAADVMRIADESEKPAACLTRNYFRYTFARFEDLEADGCALEAMRAKLDKGGHLKDMLKAVVETPTFKQRTFE